MTAFEIAPEADEDLRGILRHSRRKFGRAAATRYARLINAAYAALRADPDRSGVVGVRRSLKLFHTRHVKDQAGVAAPRHLVVFIHDRRGVRILRLYHDAMDLPARLRDL